MVSIAAVVVTRNRKALLIECLNALLNQTRPLDRIYILDQASVDGTEELFAECGRFHSGQVYYLRSEINRGGAGGFHDGLKRAYEDGFGAVWVMDDDAIPNADACEKMMPFLQYPEVAAIANEKLTTTGGIDSFHTQRSNKTTRNEYIALEFSSFVGLLIRRYAIASVGLPIPEFFVQEDDKEYCARLVTVGTIAYARESIVVHKYAAAATVSKTFLGKVFERQTAKQYCMNYFRLRNRLWLLHRGRHSARSIWEYWNRLAREIGKVVLVDRNCLIARLHVVVRGVRDGLTGRFDNEFPFALQRQLPEHESPSVGQKEPPRRMRSPSGEQA